MTACSTIPAGIRKHRLDLLRTCRRFGNQSISTTQSVRLLEATERPCPLRSQMKEFMIHGAKYCFPAEYGGLTRGFQLPTPRLHLINSSCH